MLGQKPIRLLLILLVSAIGVTGCSLNKPDFYERSLIHLESQSVIVSSTNQLTDISITKNSTVEAEWSTLTERDFSAEDFSDTLKKEFERVNLYNDAPKTPNLTLIIELMDVRLRSTLQARDLGMATGVDYIRANVLLKDAGGNIVLKSFVKSPDLYFCPSKATVLGIPVAGCSSKERAEWLYRDMAREIHDEMVGKIDIDKK